MNNHVIVLAVSILLDGLTIIFTRCCVRVFHGNINTPPTTWWYHACSLGPRPFPLAFYARAQKRGRGKEERSGDKARTIAGMQALGAGVRMQFSYRGVQWRMCVCLRNI